MNVFIKKVETRNEKDEVTSTGFALMRNQGKEELWCVPQSFDTEDEAKDFAKKQGWKVK